MKIRMYGGPMNGRVITVPEGTRTWATVHPLRPAERLGTYVPAEPADGLATDADGAQPFVFRSKSGRGSWQRSTPTARSQPVSFRVQRGDEFHEFSPRFATQQEADSYREHLGRLPAPVAATVVASEEPPTHQVDDGLMSRLDRPASVPIVIGRSQTPAAEELDYDLALLQRVEDLAQQNRHAVTDSVQTTPGDETMSVGVALTPGDSETLWHVDFRLTDTANAARFAVDMDTAVMTAPGMFPDPKHGYAAWDVEDQRVAIVFSDPDRPLVDARVISDFDGYLPQVDAGNIFAADLADLAQLIAEVVIGWRE